MIQGSSLNLTILIFLICFLITFYATCNPQCPSHQNWTSHSTIFFSGMFIFIVFHIIKQVRIFRIGFEVGWNKCCRDLRFFCKPGKYIFQVFLFGNGDNQYLAWGLILVLNGDLHFTIFWMEANSPFGYLWSTLPQWASFKKKYVSKCRIKSLPSSNLWVENVMMAEITTLHDSLKSTAQR